jgi:hypothetical protein
MLNCSADLIFVYWLSCFVLFRYIYLCTSTSLNFARMPSHHGQKNEGRLVEGHKHFVNCLHSTYAFNQFPREFPNNFCIFFKIGPPWKLFVLSGHSILSALLNYNWIFFLLWNFLYRWWCYVSIVRSISSFKHQMMRKRSNKVAIAIGGLKEHSHEICDAIFQDFPVYCMRSSFNVQPVVNYDVITWRVHKFMRRFSVLWKINALLSRHR